MEFTKLFRKVQSGGRIEKRFGAPELVFSNFGSAPPGDTTADVFGRALRLTHVGSIASRCGRAQATKSTWSRANFSRLRELSNRSGPLQPRAAPDWRLRSETAAGTMRATGVSRGEHESR